LNIALFPQAVISGRIVDEDGDPVQARVQVFALTWKHGKQHVRPRGGSMSNDLGEYRCSELSPGKYYISAQSGFRTGMSELPAIPGKADVRPVRTFFPDAPSIENAAPIRVQVGQNLTGMDIRLRTLPTYHVRGSVAGAVAQIGFQSLGVSISPRDFGLNFFFDGSNITKKGTFDLGGVPSGAYSLNLYTQSGSFHMVGSTPVEVGGSDLNDIVINVVPAGTLRGRIQVESGASEAANLGSVQIELQPTDEGVFGWGSAYAKADGSFSLEDLNPQKYNLRLFPTLEGTYIKSVQLGQQEMLGKELDFSQGVSGELLIALSYGVAEAGGTVQIPQQEGSSDPSQAKPATAASIVLVPEELRPDGSGFEYGNTTQTGTFSIKNVPPGRYRAYAFEEVKRDQMDNPDFLKQLESKGVEVDLKENGNQQVQLTLIPAADTQRILAQLGIDAQ
ncbi:MAG TPA: carboxypeptidase regulatory-like domain-containing protein, partial [Bryobacteraceae bacterium]|nr:carboxypeptidase regulatory-like domain-containing protein [Bryobacteraceae bacterium]